MSAARKPPPSPDTVAATGVSAEADVAPARRPPLTKADAEAIPMPVADAEGSDSPTSTEHIVHAVTRAIVEHRLLPGAKLVEQKIADRFGV